MLNYAGNYLLKVNFGSTEINIDTGNLKEFVIIQDIYRYLPSFTLKIIDGDGLLTHLTPLDKRLSRIHVQVGKDLENTDYNDFDFTVYQRNLIGDTGPSAVYEISGLLTTDGLFAPSYCRGFNNTVASTLTTIAKELDCATTDISANLNIKKTLLQPNYNNASFLDGLKESLSGSDGESAFQIYVKRKDGKSSLFCKDLKSIFKQPVLYNFIVSDEPVENYYPALDYEVFDNYKLLGSSSSQQQRYQYFDYYNSEYKSETLKAIDMFSLSEYLSIDKDDTIDSVAITGLGRTTACNTNFTSVTSTYHNKLNSLTKLWILSWGNINAVPGDIVKVLFAQGHVSGDLQSFNYSGYYMIERVVNTFAGTHRTRFLLTRGGQDSDIGSTLLRTTDWRR